MRNGQRVVVDDMTGNRVHAAKKAADYEIEIRLPSGEPLKIDLDELTDILSSSPGPRPQPGSSVL